MERDNADSGSNGVRLRRQLGDVDEARRVVSTITARLDDEIVADFFGGDFDASRKDPKQRLKKVDCRGNLTQ